MENIKERWAEHFESSFLNTIPDPPFKDGEPSLRISKVPAYIRENLRE